MSRNLPLDNGLEIDIQKMNTNLQKINQKQIFCTHVSNVTGYILPVEEIFREAKKHGSINVLDSAQSLGLIDVRADLMDVDLIAFAGHKTLYGPFGYWRIYQCVRSATRYIYYRRDRQ